MNLAPLSVLRGAPLRERSRLQDGEMDRAIEFVRGFADLDAEQGGDNDASY
jgi:hypothetical protein